MGADLLALGLAEASDTRVVEMPRGASGTLAMSAFYERFLARDLLTAEAVRATFPRAIYYRSRYTVLDLAREAGWFGELVDEVFGPGGLWT